MRKDEKEKRRERLKLFSNSNQWMKKRDLEQTLEDMSAQLREYRRDLQQIRMQEAATEAKIDKLQQQVNAIESSLHTKGETEKADNQTLSKTVQITDYYDKFEQSREGYTVSYSEKGCEENPETCTVNMYA